MTRSLLVFCWALGLAGEAIASVGVLGVGGETYRRYFETARETYTSIDLAKDSTSVMESFHFPGVESNDLPRVALTDGIRPTLPILARVPGLRNVRDIGGWTGLRTGRVYRGGALCWTNGVPPTCGAATAAALTEVLHIRTDLDLRGKEERRQTRDGHLRVNFCDVGVPNLVSVPLGGYLNAFVQTNAYRRVLLTFADPANFPIYVHCAGGADRTGTVVFILEALCGVSDADLAIDYELTTFAKDVYGLRRRNDEGELNFKTMVDRFRADYPGATLAEKVAVYARQTLGLTEAEIAAIRANVASTGERVLSDGWKFRKADETTWRDVRVPHDWAIEETPVRGLCPHQGNLPFVGKGYYRRAFDGFTPPKGGRTYLTLDGVQCHSRVLMNGKVVGGRPFGYASETIDVTETLLPTGNVLEVEAENVPRSSRWYPGSGIFRDVTVRVVPADHVRPNTLFIRTLEANAEQAKVAVSFEGRGGVSNFTFVVEKPRLWSPEDPALYEINLFGETFRYGIRTAMFDPQKGFFLNGVHRQMRGVCLHHDLGPIGARFDRTFARRQLARLKEMGCDAIRTSHNPPAAALLDLCDEMGLMVMDEAFDMWEKSKGDYANFWQDWHARDLTNFLRRDRSHPCVMMWSIGNELIEHSEKDPTNAIRLATELTAICHSEDPTRPVTFGSWKSEPMWNGCQNTVDCFGANYLPFAYAEFSWRNLSVGLIGTETCSTVSSRGEYFFPVVASPIVSAADLKRRCDEGREKMVRGGQVSGYDLWGPHPNDYPPDVEFAFQEKNPQVYGEFVWTGFDYIGEPDPCAGAGGRLSYFGIFDLCGFAKDRYWLYKAQWRPDVPSAHILPHWNWPGREGEVTPVHVYTSGDEAELFVNGVSLGRKRRGRFEYRFVWEKVVYSPGEVVVKTWKSGSPWAEDRVVTAGEPVRVEVEEEGDFPGFFRLKAVDAHGNFCPTAACAVKLHVKGDWRVVAAANGDATDHSPFLGRTEVRTFNGLALVVVEKAGNGSFGVTQ